MTIRGILFDKDGTLVDFNRTWHAIGDRLALEAAGGYKVPESQSPWQAIFRDRVRQFSDGMVLDGADQFRDIGNKVMPRHSH